MRRVLDETRRLVELLAELLELRDHLLGDLRLAGCGLGLCVRLAGLVAVLLGLADEGLGHGFGVAAAAVVALDALLAELLLGFGQCLLADFLAVGLKGLRKLLVYVARKSRLLLFGERSAGVDGFDERLGVFECEHVPI